MKSADPPGSAAAGPEPDRVAAEDVRLLRSMGYAQELLRRMSGFSNFAISFSIICILAGGITSLQLGVGAVGGAAAGIVWPVGVGFALIVAVCMAQIASAFPTAGGLYHWSSILGGRGWGWATAWLNLGGLLFVTAAVDVGTYTLFIHFVGPALGIDPNVLGLTHQALGVTVLLASQALLNHVGIRWTTLLTDLSAYLIFALALLLVGAMAFGARSFDVSRLVHFVNTSGAAGGDVWPATSSGMAIFLLALMWPVYTVTGFDASAHTAEETVDAAVNVPRGILRSVYLSGLLGWLMVASFVLAMPSVDEAARQGGDVFSWLMDRVVPGTFGRILWAGIVASNYLCGLACVTSTSRMLFAFARDGGLPFSAALRRVDPRYKTPVGAVWTTAALCFASTLYAPAYSTLTAASVIFLYVSYVMPTAAAFFALGRTWTRMGPFRLGRALYRSLAAVSVAGVVVLVWIGVQPPNEKALVVTVGAAGALAACWWLGVRRVFRGPPVVALASLLLSIGCNCSKDFRGIHDGDTIRTTIGANDSVAALGSDPSCGDLGDLPPGSVLTSSASVSVAPTGQCFTVLSLSPRTLSTGTLTPLAGGGAFLRLPSGCTGDFNVYFQSPDQTSSYLDDDASAVQPAFWLVRQFQATGDPSACFPSGEPEQPCTDAFLGQNVRL